MRQMPKAPRSRTPLLLLLALPLAGSGCGSSESAHPAPSSTSTAEPAPPATATATAAASTAAAPADAELDKREVPVFELDRITSELGPPKSSPEKPPSFQKLFRQVAGGQEGYCGTHTSGSVYCWGKTPVDAMTGAFVQVAVAEKFACGVEAGGALRCLPESAAPSLDSPAPAAAASATGAPSAGDSPAPAATGSDSAAGDSPAPAATTAAAPADVKYRSVAAGPAHACALDRAGHAVCWAGEGGCALPPAPEDATFRSLSVGTCHACGRDDKGGVRCWAPEGTAAASPPAGLVAKELASGDGFTCAVTDKQALSCWGSAPAAPADLPAEIESVGARAGTVCILAKGGALRCWGAFQVTQPGPFTAIAVAGKSACATVAKDKIDCFGQEAERPLAVPEDVGMVTAVDPGRTSEEIAQYKKRRADLFRELLGKLPEREAPITLDRSAKVPAGRVVDGQYLPVLDMVNLNQLLAGRYHQGFSIKAPDKKFRLIVMHDKGTPKLMSFGEDGKRIGELALTSYSMSSPDPVLFDCGDVREEVVKEATIGADLKITLKTTTTLESLGRLKNKEKKIQNYCKVRETTDVYAVSPRGAIDKVSTRGDVLHDKIADEACRGRWLRDPRSSSYKASDDVPEECARRMGR